jgi:hypothetical protein
MQYSAATAMPLPPLPWIAPFVVIPIALVLLLAWGAQAAWQRSGAPPDRARGVAIQTAILGCAWLAATWMLAARGTFDDFTSTPPPFAFLILAIVAISIAIAFSGFGRQLAMHLPLWVLVAVQGFRLPLEIAMHGMFEAGVMPVHMSYSGRNFDIVTGATALIVAGLLWWGVGGRRLAIAWNWLGLALLVNVVTVAILLMPRFQYFGPGYPNTWVLHPPFVWLPAVMVLAALAGHLLIFRAAAISRSLRPAAAAPPRSPHRPERKTRA